MSQRISPVHAADLFAGSLLCHQPLFACSLLTHSRCRQRVAPTCRTGFRQYLQPYSLILAPFVFCHLGCLARDVEVPAHACNVAMHAAPASQDERKLPRAHQSTYTLQLRCTNGADMCHGDACALAACCPPPGQEARSAGIVRSSGTRTCISLVDN